MSQNQVEHLMKPRSRETLGENINLAHKPKSYMYKHMRPNVKIYKHIPLEKDTTKKGQICGGHLPTVGAVITAPMALRRSYLPPAILTRERCVGAERFTL